MKNFKPRIRSRRAVSPVIATVILVAVAITVSVAVAYWMGGIAGGYTKFEKVEIQTGYSTKGASGWTISLELKNTGSASSTLVRAFINDVPLNQTSYGQANFVPGEVSTDLVYAGTTITSGSATTLHIWVSNSYSSLTSGTTVNIKIHSAGGMDYVKLVDLV